MLKLVIKLKGKIIQEAPVKPGVEYIIGRGKDNQIVLPDQTGISRKHLSFYLTEDGQWVVRNLSKVSGLIVNGEELEEAVVEPGSSFQTQDFEFLFQKEAEVLPEVEEKEQEGEVGELVEVDNPEENGIESGGEGEADDMSPALEGKTTIMPSHFGEDNLTAYLKITQEEDGARDIFKLAAGQEEWTVGRDETADIVVDNPNISRLHLKITQQGMDYFLQDLKSSNGTILNDKDLSPKKNYPIQSGDLIYILEIEILFELKNLALEKEIANLKTPAVPAVVNTPEQQQAHLLPSAGYYPAAPMPANHPGVIVENDGGDLKDGFFQKKKRLIIYSSIALVLGFFILSGGEKQEKEVNTNLQIQTGELAGLSPQQAERVKVTYQAAQQLYSQGKFEYCKSEIKRVHELIDSYQNSKTLETECAQAAENQRKRFDLEQKKEKAKKTEEFVQKITDECLKKFESFKERHELLTCLNPAMELVPADGRIQSLTEKFDLIEMQKKASAEKIVKRKQFISSVKSKYNYAKSLYRQGKVLQAMSAYQNFISKSNHAELKTTQATARRELANIKKNFKENNARMLGSCKNHFSSKQYRSAYYSCKKAINKVPSPHNKPAIAFMEKSKSKLEVKMKPLYEEATLNESVGNVHIAQEYWKKILKQDVSSGLYYKRAEAKMSRY